MEEKINIAAILKYKPNGTKLYSPIFGECKLSYIESEKLEPQISTESDSFGVFYFWDDGKAYNEGECLLFPSDKMRDWSKFAWKKGDLLINCCGIQCIFKEWASDDYTKFNGCYSNSMDSYEDVSNAETYKFVKLDNNTAYGYVREIEKRCGGTLNLETLEIEKTQPEFKDGDVLFVKCYGNAFIEIFNYYKNNGDLYDHASLDITNQILDISGKYIISKDEITELRLATEAERQQLFSSLEKEGKAWNADKKQIVDLKPKWTPKTFDKVITRVHNKSIWTANIFSHIDQHEKYVTIGCISGYTYCLPYNDETAHLIGTTDEWKGGEG